ncbi:hypothetical protein [Endozoicomonas sp. SESOKO3]|nr:hypothetical protein [Endozoicomonas sp. SESOKO3]
MKVQSGFFVLIQTQTVSGTLQDACSSLAVIAEEFSLVLKDPPFRCITT